MRKTVLASLVFATMIGGYTLVTTGTASAVDRATACAAVVDISKRFNNDMNALNKDDAKFESNRKKIIADFSVELDGVASKTEDGDLQKTISNAAKEMNNLSSVTNNDEFNKIAQDDNSPANKAAAELDRSCPAS